MPDDPTTQAAIDALIQSLVDAGDLCIPLTRPVKRINPLPIEEIPATHQHPAPPPRNPAPPRPRSRVRVTAEFNIPSAQWLVIEWRHNHKPVIRDRLSDGTEARRRARLLRSQLL